MGAEFITLNYDGKLSGSEVREQVVEHIRNYDPREDFDPCDYDDDEDGYDDCNQGYTGTWAEVAASCDINYDIFKNESEAEDWLAKHCEKWEGAKACRYYTNEVSPKIKALLEKDQKLKSFEEKYKVLKAKLAELVKTKPRAKKAQAAVQTKLDALKAKYSERKEQIKGKDKSEKPTAWVVGAWASC